MKNILKEKSFAFSINIIRTCQVIQEDFKEYILTKQVWRSGTAIGALIREAEFAESKKDFIHKLQIAQKEANESIYWIELLFATDYITHEKCNTLKSSCIELLKLLTSSIKTAKQRLKSN
ncbi:four helix bundle protein [Carboxylicivirga sp. A043]|uniref:four helix bundle protein n=1 Tax=Carboxylicivirga litoralis TaxID=2816963 RepID=UPI0021CB34E4|nr:four helix bundle protein [Carboxylicivirga sp. A043]MCU4156921.1 four helix bundle protein [Carboxylicivirga sp. A043]